MHEADAVTDLGGDGHAEVTIAYRLLCRGCVAADRITIVVLAGKKKYLVRG